MRSNDTPTWQKFPTDVLRRLAEAVDVNDAVDAHVDLPGSIDLACPEASMQRCFALCLQFWEEGFSRSELLRLVHKLLCGRRLSAEERLQYKYIRARYKHLRFAQRLYGRQHQSDSRFDSVTRALGNLQDAFRGGQRRAVVRYGARLRILLASPVWAAVRQSARDTRLDSAAGFLAHRQAEMRRLKELLAKPTFTGHEFHAIRKIVSQQVSFYDTLRTLEPSGHAYKMSRFLAAINGLMGSRHDEMVAASLAGQRDYGTPTPLAGDIRWRLDALVAHYPLPGHDLRALAPA